jgi:hypothetical protein
VIGSVREFLLDQLVVSAREAAFMVGQAYLPDPVPVVVTADLVEPRAVRVRAWIGLKEVVRLDLSFGSDFVASQFDCGDVTESQYVDGLGQLLLFWRDRVSEECSVAYEARQEVTS